MTKLYKYQKEDVQRIEELNGKVLLASEMGVGKTLITLTYIKRHPELRPTVIVCPACLKWVWESQASEHCSLQTRVLSGRKAKKDGLIKNRGIIIINYDILSPWTKYLKGIKPKIVIGDEVQAIKSWNAQRTRAFTSLCVNVNHIIAISGTPLTNRPSELFNTLHVLHPNVFNDRQKYKWRYCGPKKDHWAYQGYSFRGASNLKELHRKISKLGMIRRLKKDVLKDLPAKTRIVVPIDIEHPQEYREALNNFQGWLSKKSMEKARRASSAESLVKIGYLVRLASELKMKAALQWTDTFFEESEGKLVIFAHHKAIIKRIKEHYKNICVVVTGQTSQKKRKEAIQKFQKKKRIRLFIGNIRAAGVGIDLWAASTVAFIETGFVPGDVVQCEDRLHRIGQKENVSCYYLVAKDTIEEKLCKILQEKQKIITKTLDGKQTRKEQKLNVYDQLLQNLERSER
jgi:SNF2 family DNA or RNA helicase